MNSDPKIIVAMDTPTRQSALEVAGQLDPTLCRLKVGKGLFTAYGPELVYDLQKMGFEIFLDLKFHDIPNTVAHAVRSAADLGVWMLTVHALGGVKMLNAASNAAAQCQKPPRLVAVTVLTSMGDEDLLQLGIQLSVVAMVEQLVKITQQAGIKGVVCSAQEAAVVKKLTNSALSTVCPGIRLVNTEDDQTRVMTPSIAIQSGADYLVVGRPIVQSANPMGVLNDIHQQIQAL